MPSDVQSGNHKVPVEFRAGFEMYLYLEIRSQTIERPNVYSWATA
jgi:hypothetical protein